MAKGVYNIFSQPGFQDKAMAKTMSKGIYLNQYKQSTHEILQPQEEEQEATKQTKQRKVPAK